MSLSIRTQDKMGLVPYNAPIQIERIKRRVENIDYPVPGFVPTLNDIKLGIYSTQKRALEVLDEIEKALCENNVTNYEYFMGAHTQLKEYSYSKTTIYQMPKE